MSQFTSRIRFNWGFHDAQHDAAQKWPNRLLSIDGPSIPRPLPNDPAYVAGYSAGHVAFAYVGHRSDSSEPAWNASGLIDA